MVTRLRAGGWIFYLFFFDVLRSMGRTVDGRDVSSSYLTIVFLRGLLILSVRRRTRVALLLSDDDFPGGIISHRDRSTVGGWISLLLSDVLVDGVKGGRSTCFSRSLIFTRPERVWCHRSPMTTFQGVLYLASGRATTLFTLRLALRAYIKLAMIRNIMIMRVCA